MEETQIDFNEARLKARIALKEQTDAQARRAALVEEVVSALNSYKTSLGYFVGSEDYQKQVDDLIARVRAEWGGKSDE